jgi:hypothetical protein
LDELLASLIEKQWGLFGRQIERGGPGTLALRDQEWRNYDFSNSEPTGDRQHTD